MSWMDKIINTAVIIWVIALLVGVVMFFIGDAAERDEISKASEYFLYSLLSLPLAALAIGLLIGVWMNLQEMWG